MPALAHALLLAALVTVSTGCLHTSYLAQAGVGQNDIASRTRPIEEVIADTATPQRTRELLQIVQDVKRFEADYGIAATNNYREFVALDRPVVVWVVSASHPLRFDMETWWFPIVGSVPYLGWFERRDAERFAAELEAQGLDVDLRGAGAYSTLGWFDDPVLSTMIRGHRSSVIGDLVNIVIHESVHATHYVNSQSFFNESLADFVADELTPTYLRERLGLDRWQLYAYDAAQDRRARRTLRFHETYRALEQLYASDMSDEDKLAEKARITEALRSEVGFWRKINNATLAQSRAYHGGVPQLAKLLEHCGSDWLRFWRVIKQIDEASFAQPQESTVAHVLEPLLARPCPLAD